MRTAPRYYLNPYKEKINGKHWMNSVKPKSKDMVIPSQALSTLREGVETTGGVLVSLITGISVQAEKGKR